MHHSINALFDGLWQDYCQHAPSAPAIHRLLMQGNTQAIVNDHIALRTFNLPEINLTKLAEHFLSLGYKEADHYQFKEKKLAAKHFEPPSEQWPKVFISELLTEQLSEPLQQSIATVCQQIAADAVLADDFLYSGRHWAINSELYHTALAESEYAAWLLAFGFRANHFTVNVNQLSQFSQLGQVNTCLKQAGFQLNDAGGEIKGGEAVYLAQSATLADKVWVDFADKSLHIPGCFYEFAQRYPLPNGTLFSGFVEASADKIFQSTNRR